MSGTGERGSRPASSNGAPSARNGAGAPPGGPEVASTGSVPVEQDAVRAPADPRILRNWMRAILPSALFGIMGLVAGLSTGHNGVATRAIFAVFCAVVIVVLLGWAKVANDRIAAETEPPRA